MKRPGKGRAKNKPKPRKSAPRRPTDKVVGPSYRKGVNAFEVLQQIMDLN
jgi:hypothetical protein